jgi:hypothetical protein
MLPWVHTDDRTCVRVDEPEHKVTSSKSWLQIRSIPARLVELDVISTRWFSADDFYRSTYSNNYL